MSQNGESNPPPQGDPGNEQPTAAPSPPRVEAPAHEPGNLRDDDNVGNALADSVGNAVAPSRRVEDPDAQPVDEPTPGNEASPGNGNGNAQGAAGRGPRPQNPRGPQGPRGDRGDRGDRPPRRDGQGPGGAQQGGKNHRGGGGGGDPHRAFHAGDKVRAKILALGTGGALVDLWGKERGVLDLRELSTPDAPTPTVGDAVDVIVLQDGTRGGNLVVTRDANRADRNREMVAQAYNAGEPIEGLITGLNRGGLEVDIGGIRAFCPSSHIDIRVPSQQELQALVLRRELFKITQLVEGGREAVVSRRALREADVRERAEQAVTRLVVGARVTGRVVAVKEHGIFVDLGGVEGRIQLSELSHDRSARPSDIARVGDDIEAVILRIDMPATPPQGEAAGAATPAEAETAATEGTETPAGDPTAEGATAEGARTSAKGGKDARDSKESREAREAARKKQRFSRLPEGTPRVELSHRAVETDPWADVHKRFPVGSVHKGKVARMQPFGAFIELEKGLDGLLHVSEIGDKRIQHPNEVLKDGQEVSVRVNKIDRGARRIALSLLPEGVTEEQLKTSVNPRVGLITQAKIVEHDTFGVWAQIDNTVGKAGRGLILPQDSNQPKGTDLRKALPLGADVKVKVVEMDRGRLKLSIRAALQDEERQAYRTYQQQANATTVGVSLADKLRKLGLGKNT